MRRAPSCRRSVMRDNGRGFPDASGEESTEGGRKGGFGIRMLSEHMMQLSGRLDIQPDATGTTVIASLPVSMTR